MTDEIKSTKDPDPWPDVVELMVWLGLIAFLIWLFSR